MSEILVTGATGFVGSHVVCELLNNGYTVRALHRSTSNHDQLDKNLTAANIDKSAMLNSGALTLIEGDICNPEEIEDAAKGVAGIMHIAALFREAKHTDSRYYEVNVEGTKNVLLAAQKNNALMIHCSTVGVHSHIPNPPAKESEAYRPADIYQRTKCEGEKLVLRWFKEWLNKSEQETEKVKGAIIRPAMIWGPRDSRTLKLFKGVANKKFPLIGWKKTYLHWISVLDLAISFRLAFEKLQANEIESGEVFIISGKTPVTIPDLVAMIAKECGVASPGFSIPAFPVQLAGTLCEILCKPFGIEPPLYRRRVDFFTKTRWFDSSHARELLEFLPRGDLIDEVRENIDSYKSLGLL